MSHRLPPEMLERLDTPEGSLEVNLTLPFPLDHPPASRGALVEDKTPAKTLVRIDLDEGLRIHFVRQAPGGEPADVDVDVTALRGAQRLGIVGTWSPFAMQVHVVDRDQPSRMVTSESQE